MHMHMDMSRGMCMSWYMSHMSCLEGDEASGKQMVGRFEETTRQQNSVKIDQLGWDARRIGAAKADVLRASTLR